MLSHFTYQPQAFLCSGALLPISLRNWKETIKGAHEMLLGEVNRRREDKEVHCLPRMGSQPPWFPLTWMGTNPFFNMMVWDELCPPPKSYMEALGPSPLECDCIWKYSL